MRSIKDGKSRVTTLTLMPIFFRSCWIRTAIRSRYLFPALVMMENSTLLPSRSRRTPRPLDAFPPRSAAACARSWSDLAAARSALVLEIGAAPANPPPATRCHAPPQSLRNIRSAASENTALAHDHLEHHRHWDYRNECRKLRANPYLRN